MAESRVEDLLETGVEQPVLPMSEIEAILRGEPVTPHSRIAELLLKYNPSDILIEKRITENGTYFATNDNADGYYKVVVDEYVPTLILKEVTANGTYDPAVDGADGYSSIRVNLPLEHQIGEVFNQNGLYHVTPSQGYEGISRADIMVQVNPVLETKTIDANGTYTPSQGYDGFSEVTVDVPGQNADLALRCVGLDGYSVTITSADNSETYTKSVTGSPATITFDNLVYVGNWTVTNTKDSTAATVSNAVSNEDYKLYTQQIPRMTAYDQPSGVISASSEYDNRFLAWFAAANNGGSGGNGWMGTSMNSYLIYQFATPVIFSKLYFYIADVWGFNYYNIREYGNDIDVLGSVDGTTYERCTSTGSTVNKKGYGDVNIDLNGKKYKYLKVIVPKATFSRDYYNCGVMNLMLYSDPEATAYMLGSKSITANGTYNPASDGLDGFSEVTVDVPLPSNAYLLKDIPSTPTDIATISDGANLPMPYLKVGVDAQQDLHGYDSPWAGGAGKNKLKVTATSQTINGVTFTVKEDGTITTSGTATATAILFVNSRETYPSGSYILNGCPMGGGNSTYKLDIPNASATDKGSGETFDSDGTTELTVRVVVYSGYGDNLTFKPMIRLATETDATFAPYSNICPIIGWDEVKVTRTGKNLFDIDAEHSAVDESYSYNFTVKPNTAYTMSSNVPFSSPSSLYFNGGASNVNGVGLGTPRTFTSDANGHLSAYVRYVASGGAIDLYTAVKNGQYYIQFEESTTPTTYEPYNGLTYTIDLDGIRYGGYIEIVNGQTRFVATHKIVDLGTLTWVYAQSQYVFYTASLNGENSNINNPIYLCSEYSYAGTSSSNESAYNKGNNSVSVYTGDDARIYIRDDNYNVVSEFTESLNGVQLVYELEEPIIIPLSPTPISTLEGETNLFADSGQILDGEYLAK